MARDSECDLCRNGVVQTPEAVRAWLREQGRLKPPPRYFVEIAGHVAEHVSGYDRALLSPSGEREDVDVLVAEPAPERPFYLLVTAGMSDRAMSPPEGVRPDLCRAELTFLLPPWWHLTRSALSRERWAWPVRLLGEVARYVRETDAWLWCRHTFAFGDGPLAAEAPFTELLFHHSAVLPEGFAELDLGGGESIHFLSLWPLFREEFELARRSGADSLVDRLLRSGVTDILAPGRRCAIP